MPRDLPHRITVRLKLMEMAVNDHTLDNLHSIIEHEIVLSSHRIQDASRSADESFHEAVTDNECDRVEQLLGLAFVAAQTFITTVRSSIARLSQICKNDLGSPLSFVTSLKAHELLKLAEPMRNYPKYTEIEVINAVANYWKHQEEWPIRIELKDEYREQVWDQTQMRPPEKLTVQIVASIGMAPSSTGNLRTAYEAFDLASSYEDLSPIRDKLRTWAHTLQGRVKSEVSTHA